MMIDASTAQYCLNLKALYCRLEQSPMDKTLPMRIRCEFITLLREVKNVSLEEMAETLNLPIFAVLEIEKGQFPMSPRTFFELSKSLGKPLESLVLSRKLQRKIQNVSETVAIQYSSYI